MAQRPFERRGFQLRVKRRRVDFSFWPMRRSTARYGLQSRIFASEPWNLIQRAVNEDCPQPARGLALAFLEQARDFATAAQLGSVRAAKPLLIYYSFMNLVKTFALTKQLVPTLSDTHHGLTVDFSFGAGPVGVKIKAFPTSATTINLFDLFLRALTGTGIAFPNVTYELDRVLPQILLGHQLWSNAADQIERFIEVNRIEFRERKKFKQAWLFFDLVKTEYMRFGYTQTKVIRAARLSPDWSQVRLRSDDRTRLRFQATIPKVYTSRASDVVNDLVQDIKYTFWRSITIVPPFRKYYVYLADPADRLLPQLCSIYMVFFYLGSITRYRPNQFDELIAGPYGAFFQEFIENQPNQWLYMLASEFSEQEVTRAAVV